MKGFWEKAEKELTPEFRKVHELIREQFDEHVKTGKVNPRYQKEIDQIYLKMCPHLSHIMKDPDFTCSLCGEEGQMISVGKGPLMCQSCHEGVYPD